MAKIQKRNFKDSIKYLKKDEWDKLRGSIDNYRDKLTITLLYSTGMRVGVSDDGKIVGIDKKHQREIANIAHTCKPSVYPRIETLEIKGNNIFIIEVKKSDSLHSFENVAYKGMASHDKPLSPEKVVEFAKDTGKIKWDKQVCEGASLNDIDKEKVKWFLRKAKYERNYS